MQTPSYQQPIELPALPVWPLAVAVALVLVVVYTQRHRLMMQAREAVTARLGEPLATRELTPADLFNPSPRAQRIWEEVGLVIDGQGPIIRPSNRFNVAAWEVRQPRLSPKKLAKAVDRLVACMDSPSYTTNPGLRIVEGGSIHVAFVRA